DGGEAVVSGFELSAGYEFDDLFNRGWSVPVSLVWTLTNQFEFRNSFDSGFGPWGDVMGGYEMPYIPRNQGQLAIGLVGSKFGLHLKAGYQDETRAVAGSGPILAGEGTDSKWVLDVSADYALTPKLDLFLRVENLLDETYIAALRPAGLRPGKDRSAFVGFRIDL
ncbi:MAG: TonB-dependent receptor, partial [Proteobacteria bacterium]|nr:TonB-dependent receptor [Pseudomonadota bacterium]